MSKAKRLIALILEMNNRKAMTVQALADEVGVSKRTILRDLQELSELGYPVYSEVGRNGGYRILDQQLLPPLRLSEAEATAIYFAAESLKYLGAFPYSGPVDTALGKFYSTLPDETKKKLDAMKERMVIWHPTFKQNNHILETILEAAAGSYLCKIKYQSTDRSIYPVGIYLYRGLWYCPAYCLKRGDYRLFRADRIERVEGKPETLKPSYITDERLESWLFPEQQKGPESLKLKALLTEEGIKRAESHLWLREHIERMEDGSGKISLYFETRQIDFYTEIVWGLGAEIKVLAPSVIKERLMEKAQVIIGIYK